MISNRKETHFSIHFLHLKTVGTSFCISNVELLSCAMIQTNVPVAHRAKGQGDLQHTSQRYTKVPEVPTFEGHYFWKQHLECTRFKGINWSKTFEGANKILREVLHTKVSLTVACTVLHM